MDRVYSSKKLATIAVFLRLEFRVKNLTAAGGEIMKPETKGWVCMVAMISILVVTSLMVASWVK